MRYSERVALIYFVYLAAICWARDLTLPRRLLVTAASVLMIAAIIIVAKSGDAFPCPCGLASRPSTTAE